MSDWSPLQRAPEQPPCDASAESLVLNGVFAVPERMQRFNLGPHLLFPEHRKIWRAMQRAGDGPGSLWLRTLLELTRTEGPLRAAPLLDVLDWSPHATVDGSIEGCMVFMLAFKRIEWCSDARRRIHAASEVITSLSRVPDRAYSPDEKRVLFGSTLGARPADW